MRKTNKLKAVRRLKAAQWIAGITVLAAVLGFTMAACGGGGGGGNPAAVTKAFLAAVEKNDAKAMEKTATKDTVALMSGFGEKAAEAMKGYGKVTGVTEQIDGDTATVKVTFANGETTDVDLVKEEGKWLVKADK